MAVGTIVAYLTDPPTSGNHYPWPQAGYYFETPVMPGFLVHSMEHGGVIIYYNPATVTDAQKDILKTLAHDHPGIFAQVVCVPRDDPAFPIILTAWTHRLRLPAYDQDRIDGFLTLFLGHGPEAVPIPPWNDPALSNATAISFYTGAPDLTISDTARPGWGSTTTVLSYLAESIALSVDLQVSAASALADTESIQILDSTSAEVLALAVYDASTGLITFSIGPTSFPPVALATGATHAVTFMVDADHNAAWSAGATTTSPVVAFGTPTIRLGLRADFSDGEGAAPTFFFGNIVVSP